MKSFINLKTGIIEIPNNSMVIEQYQKRTDLYAEYKPVESKKVDKEPTLNELKKKAKEMGISYDNKVTKAELLELISANENN